MTHLGVHTADDDDDISPALTHSKEYTIFPIVQGPLKVRLTTYIINSGVRVYRASPLRVFRYPNPTP